jgi:hypothetical protein
MPFPREQQISQHDLIQATANGLFEEFDAALDDAGHSETFMDFDYTEVPLPGQPLHGGQSHVVARPQPNVGQKDWVRDCGSGEWYEDAQVDTRGQVVDQAGKPCAQQPQQVTAGQCPNCGAGSNGPFCSGCGSPMPQAVAAPLPGLVPPPIFGAPPVPPGPGPGYNANRMTGTNKPAIEQPPELGKDKGEQFGNFLDKLFEAEEKSP